MEHEYYMSEAIKEAEISIQQGSFPFSVIVVDKDT
jgi:tRNA(Arg) A34 adenosine deaminase TadA